MNDIDESNRPDPDEKEEDMSFDEDLTKEKLEAIRTRDTFETTFNVANSMMGVGIMPIPAEYFGAGIISSFFASLVMGFFFYKTCEIILRHSRDDEIDYPEAIGRVLGRPWVYIFNVTSALLLFLVGVLHFQFMAQILLVILENFPFDVSHWGYIGDSVYKTFSYQWCGLIVFFVCMFIFSFKNLRTVLKINDKGLYLIMVFCLFLLYLGFDTLGRKAVTFSTLHKDGAAPNIVPLFTKNLTNIMGTFATAFIIHNVVCGMMKPHKHQDKNGKSIGIAYIIVTIAYNILGILGGIAFSGLLAGFIENKSNPDPSTFLIFQLLTRTNPFLSTAQMVIATIAISCIFVQLTSVIPVLCFFTRRQTFGIWYGRKHKLNNYQFHIFNFLYAGGCFIFVAANINVINVINFTGSVTGFLLVYVIPIFIHLKCSYKLDFLDFLICKKRRDDRENLNEIIEECRDHTDDRNSNFVLTLGFYIVILAFGIFVLVESIRSDVAQA